jgi:hypothetical protein
MEKKNKELEEKLVQESSEGETSSQRLKFNVSPMNKRKSLRTHKTQSTKRMQREKKNVESNEFLTVSK